MTVIIFQNCRFQFTSVQQRTSLYYQPCHSLKNRDRIYMLQNRRHSLFVYFYLWLSADTTPSLSYAHEHCRNPEKVSKKVATLEKKTVLCWSTFFFSLCYADTWEIILLWKKRKTKQKSNNKTKFDIFENYESPQSLTTPTPCRVQRLRGHGQDYPDIFVKL